MLGLGSRIHAIASSVIYHNKLYILELGSKIHAIASSVIYPTQLHKLQALELGYPHSVTDCVPDRCGLFPGGKVPECDADVCSPGTNATFPFFRILKALYCAQLDCVIPQKTVIMKSVYFRSFLNFVSKITGVNPSSTSCQSSLCKMMNCTCVG